MFLLVNIFSSLSVSELSLDSEDIEGVLLLFNILITSFLDGDSSSVNMSSSIFFSTTSLSSMRMSAIVCAYINFNFKENHFKNLD